MSYMKIKFERERVFQKYMAALQHNLPEAKDLLEQYNELNEQYQRELGRK